MNKLTQTFFQSLQKGFDAAKTIAEPKDKALAYAKLASAIASTGLVEDCELEITESENKETKKETKKNSKGKDSLKAESGKGKTTPKIETEIAPVEEADPTPSANEPIQAVESQETEISDTWTEEATAAKAESLETLRAYTDAWTEDYVYNTCVPAFFENPKIVGKDNIRPTNIDGFISYLEQIAQTA